jgi:4-diphosphocytidyl-2-C-methyl-D-erythritol kinase
MRWIRAPAKINLTLRVTGRRADGYHELESLVAFAGLCDWVTFESGAEPALEIFGPRALDAGPVDDNLVLRAARALAALIPGLRLGRFRLLKRLPASAGLGGGSSDAAAALRLLADEAGLPIDDPRVHAAARATGADVLACLRPEARMMTGVGDQLGPAIALPKMVAVLVNPKVEAPTPKVFAALGLAPGARLESSARPFDPMERGVAGLLGFLSSSRNDLEAAAVRIAPAIAVVRDRLSRIPGAAATGMSGSGATCFALFSDRRSATLARRVVAAERPDWWVEATAIR